MKGNGIVIQIGCDRIIIAAARLQTPCRRTLRYLFCNDRLNHYPNPESKAGEERLDYGRGVHFIDSFVVLFKRSRLLIGQRFVQFVPMTR